MQLIHLIRKQSVHVPGILKSHYPELEKIAAPEAAASPPQQVDLLFETSAADRRSD